jgi:DNA-binding Lrp family transcriptional regulator
MGQTTWGRREGNPAGTCYNRDKYRSITREGEQRMISALVLINVERGKVNETAESLLEIEGVAEVYSVAGEYDLVALLRLRTYEDLADVVTRHIDNVPTITKTNTLMAFQCYSRADLQQAWDIGIE